MAEIPETPVPPGLPGTVNDYWPASLGPLLFLAAIFLINFLSRIIFGPLLVEIEQELTSVIKRLEAFFFLLPSGTAPPCWDPAPWPPG